MCGYDNFKNCDQIQHRVMRFFLKVHKNAPILGLLGDIGWVSLFVDRQQASIFGEIDLNSLSLNGNIIYSKIKNFTFYEVVCKANYV